MIKYSVYDWTGIDETGATKKGFVPAEDVSLAEKMLHLQGIEITSLRKKHSLLAMGLVKKVKAADIVIFARQLATMVTAGIPLVQALAIVGNGLEHSGMRAIVFTIYTDVSAGNTLADALKRHPQAFDKLICSLIEAGERAGTLDAILGQIADYLEKSEILKARVKKAMFYPVIVLTVTVGVAVLLLTFIVPQFQEMFSSFGTELPGPTQVVIALSDAIQAYWSYMVGFVMACIIAFVLGKRRSEKFRNFLDLVKIKVFIFGELINKSIIARVSRTLAIMLAAGIPLVDSLKTVSVVADNHVYYTAIMDIHDNVIGGKEMYLSMAMTKLFPQTVLQMIGVGEKSGSMESMLLKIADYYDEQVDNMVDGMSTLIEPIMLVVLGTVVGGFVVSMYLPIFKLGEVL